ncbi:hypothetical protein UlMin_040695 [Ulmus minor]
MVKCKLPVKKKETDWLNSLLRCEFFESCVHHEDVRKNEKNWFCIDCHVGFCRHCVSVHCLHRRLQICKYVYHNVVRFHDIQKHLDCSKIQTYKINGEKAVHLNPRPQPKDAKPSTKAICAGSCEACGRYLQDPPNHFCSIQCKISVVQVKPKENRQNFMSSISQNSQSENSNSETNQSEIESSLSLAESGEEVHVSWISAALKPRNKSFGRKKKKGNPTRSPLF